ncbi:hypothetical protein AB0D65_18900 [Streptomyces griseoloalbus]|uniref:Uncharacterized protein n=1 Tax=Streptomyces griseoloalbus TaxID=67303 RepID=A0ABV3E8M7_9ACTN
MSTVIDSLFSYRVKRGMEERFHAYLVTLISRGSVAQVVARETDDHPAVHLRRSCFMSCRKQLDT